MADGNGGTALAVAEPTMRFGDEQRRLIRDMVSTDCKEYEFDALLALCEVRGMNPLLGDCYFVSQWDSSKKREVWSVRTSIDWMRARAEATGLYAGQDEPEYEYDERGKLVAARVRIYRKDWNRPTVGVAHFDEYVQTTRQGEITKFWRTKPRLMLAKCAEAIGIRKSFPRRFAQVYIAEEGVIEDTSARTPAQRAGTVPASVPQLVVASDLGQALLRDLEAAVNDEQCVAVGRAKFRAAREGKLGGDEAVAIDREIARKREDLRTPPPPPDSGPTPPDAEDDHG